MRRSMAFAAAVFLAAGSVGGCVTETDDNAPAEETQPTEPVIRPFDGTLVRPTDPTTRWDPAHTAIQVDTAALPAIATGTDRIDPNVTIGK